MRNHSNPICLKRFFSPVVFGILFFSGVRAQPPQYKMQSYIAAYSEVAIAQMIEYKIPASVIMAQAIFESRCGGSELAKKSNNHFGIKCHLEWEGDTIVKSDDTLNECFRSYNRIEDSYTDHSLFLKSRSRYAALFDLPVSDYKAWCRGLKEAGYATYETYAEELIKLIEQTKLYELDAVAPLKNGLQLTDNHQNLRLSKYQPSRFSLKQFSENNLLWTDELEAHIRSLDFLLRRPTRAGTEGIRK